MSLKEDTVKGVKWTAFGDYSNTIITFATSIFLARMLEPSDYGLIGMAAIFFTISNILMDSGFSMALIQKKNANDLDFSTVFYTNIAISLLCYIVLFLFSSSIASFFNESSLNEIIRVSGLSLVISSFGAVHFAYLKKNINFKKPAIISLFANIISGIVALFLAYYGAGVWALVIQSLLSCLINVLLVTIYSKWKPKFLFSWQSFRKMFNYGGKIMLTNLLSQAFSNLQNLFIGKFYTSRDLGFYTRGHQISTVPLGPLFGVISKVTLPIMAKIQDNDKLLIEYYKKLIRTSSLIVFFFMTLLASLAKPFVILLLSSKWEPSIVYLQLFCFCSMFAHITNSNINLLLAKGYSSLNLKCELYRKLVWGIALVISLPISVFALCLSSAIAAQGSVFINTYYTGKLFNYGYLQQIKDFSPYLFLSILSCIPAFMFTFLNIPPIITLVLGVISATALYFGYLFMRKDEILILLLESLKIRKNIKFCHKSK